MAKIVGPGSLIADVTAFAPHLPVGGETVKGTSVRFGPGGKGSNQMTAAHRAGTRAISTSSIRERVPAAAVAWGLMATLKRLFSII